MKKRYFIIVTAMVVLVIVILGTRSKELPEFKLKPRSSVVLGSPEWQNTRKAIEELQAQVKKFPDKKEPKLLLANAYVQEARITGDHNYYEALAFQLVNDVLKDAPDNFEALSIKANLQLSAHQFSDALETAKKGIILNKYSAFFYGVLCDANLELGNYNDAIKAVDQMADVRPDIRSYSRVSYLREITGDYKGAIEAMQMALNSGFPGVEQTEWIRTYLGRLYEITGDQNKAFQLYEVALSNRNFYAPALAGLARIAKSNKHYSEAIAYYTKANETMMEYSYHLELSTLYRLTNKKVAADKEFDIALQMLLKHQHPTNQENGIGHNIDRELALVYLSINDFDKAYNHAMMEYNIRPKNCDVNETLAWVCFNGKRYNEAEHYILNAMNTGSKNAELWYKAGKIFEKNNHQKLAMECLEVSKSVNPKLNYEFITPIAVNLAIK